MADASYSRLDDIADELLGKKPHSGRYRGESGEKGENPRQTRDSDGRTKGESSPADGVELLSG